MTPFTTLSSVVAPLLRDNIDTDTIIPSREMRSTGRTGLADGLFAPWRYVEGRAPDPAFALNQPAFANAKILASGANFGCGSSREHAVWALAEWGIRAIVAESFAPIFAGNCIRNGVLPVALGAQEIAEIAGQQVTVDLPAQTIAGHSFAIDSEAKAMLVGGLDAIALTLKRADAIATWATRDRTVRPWVYLQPPHPQDGEGTRDAQRRGGGVSAHTPPPSAGADGFPPHALRREDERYPRLKKSSAGVARARKLRRELSPPERRLWAALRDRPASLKFRNQHPADPYTLDFYCATARLCIEVDSEAHERGDCPQRDARRDAFLEQHGVITLRVAASDIMRDLDAVVRHIAHTASQRLPAPSHRHDGEG